MLVDEIVQQRPFQTAAHAAVHPEARAGQLRAALIVDQAEVGAEVDVMLRLKVEGMRLAVVAQRLVVLLAAGLQVGVGQVRKAQHQRAILGLDVAERLVVLGDLRLQLGHALEDRRDVLARLFLHRDLFRDAVLLGLVRLGRENQRAALGVQLENAVDLRVAVDLLCTKTGLDGLGIFLDSFDIQHKITSLN